MTSLHDKFAEASAKAAFETYKSAPNREQLVKMLADAWEEHGPLMDASAHMGATDYTFEIETEIDYTIKEIEQDMLPLAWATFVRDGHTFNWKYDHKQPFRYQFAFRWGHKRGQILKELKRKFHEEEEAAKKQRLREQRDVPPPRKSDYPCFQPKTEVKTEVKTEPNGSQEF